MLSKKHNAIKYYAVQEAAAVGVRQVTKEDTLMNLADLFTRCYLPIGGKSALDQSNSIFDMPRFLAMIWPRYLLREHNLWAAKQVLEEIVEYGLWGLFHTSRAGNTVYGTYAYPYASSDPDYN